MRTRSASRAFLAGLMITLTTISTDRAVLAHGDNNDPNAIHACTDRNGNLRVVSLGQDCRAGESRLHWAVAGPQGPPGATGSQGPTGPTGPPGPAISGLDDLAGIACSREGFPGVVELGYAAGGVVVLTCAVNASEASLAADPTSLSFNAPGTKNVTITNTGQLSSGLLTVSLTGDTVRFHIVSDTCSGLMLAGSASCVVSISFGSITAQPTLGTVSVTGTPGGLVHINLMGQDLS